MCTKLCSYGFNYIAFTSPQPFFDLIDIIIMNHYLSLWFPVQSLHTIAAILFCDITKTTLQVSLIPDLMACPCLPHSAQGEHMLYNWLKIQNKRWGLETSVLQSQTMCTLPEIVLLSIVCVCIESL